MNKNKGGEATCQKLKKVKQMTETEMTIKKALLERCWKQQDMVDLSKIYKFIIDRAIHDDMASSCRRVIKKIYKVLGVK